MLNYLHVLLLLILQLWFSPQRGAWTGDPASARPPPAAAPLRMSTRLLICQLPAARPQPDWTPERCTAAPQTCATHRHISVINTSVINTSVPEAALAGGLRRYLTLTQRHTGSQWSSTSLLLSSVSASSFPEGDTAKARTLSLPVSSEPPPSLMRSDKLKFYWSLSGMIYVIAAQE